MSSGLRLLLDLGPLAVFFIAYRLGGLMAATAALIVATLLSLAVTYLKERKVAVMPLVTAVAVLIFGGLTLILQDELFIKMKPTFVNLLFAAVLLGGLACGRPLLRYLLEHAVHLTDQGWRILSLRWGVFFLFLAGLNELIWRSFSTEFWVNFKVFGMLTLTLLFTFAQVPLIQRHLVRQPAERQDP